MSYGRRHRAVTFGDRSIPLLPGRFLRRIVCSPNDIPLRTNVRTCKHLPVFLPVPLGVQPASPPNGRLPRDLKAAKILTAARSASQEIERSIAGNRFHGRPTSFGPSDVYGSRCSRAILGSFLGDGCCSPFFLWRHQKGTRYLVDVRLRHRGRCARAREFLNRCWKVVPWDIRRCSMLILPRLFDLNSTIQC